MSDLPRHPETPDADPSAAGPGASRRPWLWYVVLTASAAGLVLMIVLHLTGTLGAGDH